MAEGEVITSLSNPRVKRVVRWRKPRERRAAGVLIAEGRREVSRALAAGLVLRELFVCDALRGEERAGESPEATRGLASLGPRHGGDSEGETVGERIAVSEAVLRKMAYHDKPEGVLGVFDAPAWTLEALPTPGPDALYLVAVGTEKPGNLGAMVRTAAAAGCAAVLAVGLAVDVFNPNAIRNSTGAVFALPTVVVEDAADALAWLHRHGVAVVAAVVPEAGGGAVSCFEAAWSWPAAVVVGPEHAGLDRAWQEAADVAVTIPMAPGNGSGSGGGVDSLNASAAAAVLLYEAVRRRESGGAAAGRGR